MKIGHGIFMWDGGERRSRRYGAFYPAASSFDKTAEVTPHLDEGALRALAGRRVAIWCVVIESRDSGHVGDVFLRIKPSRPERDEVIPLGVGILRTAKNDYNATSIVLQPSDRRSELWIDPRKLYQLHDQTVDIFAEETDEPESPKADLTFYASGAISNGDGTFQCSGIEPKDSDRILPDIEPFGDGMFAMTLGAKAAGERVHIVDYRGRKKGQ